MTTVSKAAQQAWVTYKPPDKLVEALRGNNAIMLLRHVFFSGWNSALSATPRTPVRQAAKALLAALDQPRETFDDVLALKSTQPQQEALRAALAALPTNVEVERKLRDLVAETETDWSSHPREEVEQHIRDLLAMFEEARRD